jgi:hypothetical protein
MTMDIPKTLAGLPIHWEGTDDSTPAGCTLLSTVVLGIPTTYILRNGAVIGRVEAGTTSQNGYAGAGLKGGIWVGSGGFSRLAQAIAERPS